MLEKGAVPGQGSGISKVTSSQTKAYTTEEVAGDSDVTEPATDDIITDTPDVTEEETTRRFPFTLPEWDSTIEIPRYDEAA